MSAADRDIIEIPASPETKRRFEDAARAMNLTAEAYYLMERARPGVDVAQWTAWVASHVRKG